MTDVVNTDPTLLAQQAVNFLRDVRPGGPWTLSHKAPPPHFPTRTFTTAEDARDWIQAHNGQNDLYWTVARLRTHVSKKPTKADILEVTHLHLDIDPPSNADDGWRQAALLRLTQDRVRGVPEPTIILNSGRGLQVFWALREPLRIDGDPVLASEAERYTRQLALLFDGDDCFNIDRVMRVPYTRNLKNGVLAKVLQFKRENVYALDEFKAASAPVKKSAVVVGVDVNVDEAPRRLASIDELDQWSVPDRIKIVCVQGKHPEQPKAGDNSRSAWLHDACCNLVRCGVPDSVVFAIITDPGFHISESVLELKSKAQSYALRQLQRAKEHVAADAAEFQKTDEGKVKPTQHNVRVALAKLGVRLRHDQFSDRLLIEGLPGYGPVLQDEAIARMYLRSDAEFGLRVPKELFWMVVEDEARLHGFHPVKEYLDGLEWDGTPRVNEWLVTYGGADSNEYSRAVGALVLIAAVRRIRQPGCKFDEMLVLRSPQGSMKSTALATLVPEPDWFTDDLPLGADTKVIIERLHGRWIVEAAELKGMRNSDVEGLKAFLSRSVDRARMAYGRIPKEVPRQCIVVGTTNSEKFLRDTTGNRRFWPVEVQQFDIAALRRDRDQLWAEAARREAAGESIRLDPSLYAAAAAQQEEHRVEDPFVDLLASALGDLQGKLLAADLWDLLGVAGAQRSQEQNQRVGVAMRELGWERTKLSFDGVSQWCYKRGNPKRIYVRRSSDGRMVATHDIQAEDGLPL